MNKFAEIFDATANFLRAKRVSPKMVAGKKASQTSVEGFRKQTGVAIPENFSAFYTDFADGFEFRWENGEDESGVFAMPSLDQLMETRRDWEKNVRDFLDDPKSLNQCVKRPFRAEAFKIWHQMKAWVPFWDEGNGDHFCFETPSGRILYDQHDWFDGFGSITRTNGIIAGDSLFDFVQSWSRFCFQPNKSLWWGEFGKFGAIKWEPDYFGSKFFRRSFEDGKFKSTSKRR